MKDINKMMKCRAIFLYNIGLIYGDFNILDDENLYILLEGFLDDYIEGKIKRKLDDKIINNFEIFNMLYYFKVADDDHLCVYEEPGWGEMLKEYMMYFAMNDTKNILKIYDEIGYDNIDKLTELVKLFYSYVMTLNDMNESRVRS